MAGCECPKFQKSISDNDIEFAEDGFGTWGWTAGNEYFWNFCPWCGSKLTEEAGDEAE